MQEIGDRAVSIAGETLGGKNRFIDGQVASREPAEHVANTLHGVFAFGFVQQSGARNRARIHHRIEWAIVGTQPDGVERISARLDANLGFDTLGAEYVERKREYESLGNRLNCKRHGRIAGLVDVPVHGRQRDAEMARVGLLQLWDVIRDGTTILVQKRRVGAGEKICERVGN